MDIDAFHLVRFGLFETLYQSGTFSSSMRKHAWLMFMRDKCSSCSLHKHCQSFSFVPVSRIEGRWQLGPVKRG